MKMCKHIYFRSHHRFKHFSFTPIPSIQFGRADLRDLRAKNVWYYICIEWLTFELKFSFDFKR